MNKTAFSRHWHTIETALASGATRLLSAVIAAAARPELIWPRPHSRCSCSGQSGAHRTQTGTEGDDRQTETERQTRRRRQTDGGNRGQTGGARRSIPQRCGSADAPRRPVWHGRLPTDCARHGARGAAGRSHAAAARCRRLSHAQRLVGTEASTRTRTPTGRRRRAGPVCARPGPTRRPDLPHSQRALLWDRPTSCADLQTQLLSTHGQTVLRHTGRQSSTQGHRVLRHRTHTVL